MEDEPNNNYSELIKNSIVTPIKQKFGDVSRQISELKKKVRMIAIWLFVISVLLLGNMLFTAYLLISKR